MGLDKSNVAACLRANRARRQISREELSKMTGISESALATYENAEVVMSFENAWAIADAFGMSMDELFERKKPTRV